MIWAVVSVVFVFVGVSTYFALSHEYRIWRRILQTGLLAIYSACASGAGYVRVATEEVRTTAIVTRKREEVVEDNGKWRTVYHYLITSDNMEYWCDFSEYRNIKAGDEIEVECVFYEGKLKSNKLVREEN